MMEPAMPDCLLGLVPEVEIDGCWLGSKELGTAGVLSEVVGGDGGATTRRLAFENRSGQAIRLGGFRWRRIGGIDGFFATPGRRLRIFLEGWTMASPSASVRFGDRDFSFNPDYNKFVACAPDERDDTIPNRFHAEHLVALNDAETGRTLVIGFVTSADQYGRFRLRLAEEGLAEFEAVCDADGREVAPGETVESETQAWLGGDDGETALCAFADLWGRRMRARVAASAPTGWCSWYRYFSGVTEADILENAHFLAEHRDRYPLEYIQLDDGYQSALGDWLTVNEKFPNGLAHLARAIRGLGFKPALWVGPFMVGDDSELLRRHPDWVLRTPEGEVCFPMDWRGGRRVAALDGTHPGVRAHLGNLFRELRAMGFEYVKLDFMMIASSAPGHVRHDRKSTRAQALRRGLAAIREGFGDDGFLLACTTPFGPTVGLVDGARIATDIVPYWAPDRRIFAEAPTVPNVCRNVINRAYMHRRLWLNDPDVLIAREDNCRLTDNEVRLWRDALRLTGGMLFFGDGMADLSPERARLSQDLLAEADAWSCVPLDRWERTPPAHWLATHRVTGRQLLGRFNFGETPQTDGHGPLPPHTSWIERF